MKPSVSPHVVALLVFTSLSSLGAETVANPTTPSIPKSSETSILRNFRSPVAVHPGGKVAAAFKSSVPIPRAIPVVTAAPTTKPAIHLGVRREPVSFHPITVKNGPQPYVVDPDSLQKGLALISELYRKSSGR